MRQADKSRKKRVASIKRSTKRSTRIKKTAKLKPERKALIIEKRKREAFKLKRHIDNLLQDRLKQK